MQIRSENASLERINEVLRYDAETGKLYWIKQLSPRGLVGSEAGAVKPSGYRGFQLDGKPYLSHRVAWLIATGNWPKQFLDHKNGKRDDNRIENLREADYWINNQNRTKANRNSRTGVIGVIPKGARFEVRIRTTTHPRKYLGTFDTIEEAKAIYAAAKRIYHTGKPETV